MVAHILYTGSYVNMEQVDETPDHDIDANMEQVDETPDQDVDANMEQVDENPDIDEQFTDKGAVEFPQAQYIPPTSTFVKFTII